jgi:hypothetical protein
LDAFEQIVSEILISQGYWVQTSFKVELTKAEKREIGRFSAPRWELDIVAYKGMVDELLVVECKSYFDSRGVTLSSLCLDDPTNTKSRYKLFAEEKLRTVVFSRLVKQLSGNGSCKEFSKVNLALACGKIATETDREGLMKAFNERGWKLFDLEWLKEGLNSISSDSYENRVSSVASKILIR